MTDALPPPARAKRRRSAYISTLLIGGAALALAGCDGGEPMAETEARVFPNIEACKREMLPEDCDRAFDQSAQAHLQTAPRFESQAACEEQMGPGACQQAVATRPDGSMTSMFMPAMMGFMLARALQPGGPRYQPHPVYVDRDGYMRSGNGRIGPAPGGREGFRQAQQGTTMTTPVNRSGQVGQPTRTTNRGGFGASSRGYSGGG